MSLPEQTIPQAKPITVDVNKTALLVLDLTEEGADPSHSSHRLMPGISKFLARARTAGMPIVFSVSFYLKGKPAGQVYRGLNRRASEVVVFPDGFDKFTDGELENLLRLYDGIDTLVVVGCRSNICVLHTATTAARELNYSVIVPIDGLSAKTEYEEQYTLFHLANLPGEAGGRFVFTNLDMISFQSDNK
ncbi:cysteine hydrolase family protein [Chloroflexota bacterium]